MVGRSFVELHVLFFVFTTVDAEENLAGSLRIAQQVGLLCGTCKIFYSRLLWLGVYQDDEAVRLNVNEMQLLQAMSKNVDLIDFVARALG